MEIERIICNGCGQSRNWRGSECLSSCPCMETRFDYCLIESRPESEGGPLGFTSPVENLDEKPEQWKLECPYSFRYGRIVKN